MKEEAIGRWAFLLGIIIAVLVGFVQIEYTALLLTVLGLIVGFLNIGNKESHNYLVASIALLLVGIGGIEALATLEVTFYDWTQSVMSNFIAFVSASTLVVALKEILKIEHD